jgi:Fur family iron response transcriptional regulator
MSVTRPFAPLIDRLKQAGLRPTRQRLALAKLLFEPGFRHVTAEQLHAEVASANMRVSLATVYNTLHQRSDERARDIAGLADSLSGASSRKERHRSGRPGR